MNYYQFHIGDYAGHTRHLSLMEDLAYRRLLDAYYLGERPLNGRSTDVARAIGMRDEIEAVEYVLETFFERDGEDWRNKRADAEIAHFLGKKQQASNAGKASAERRRNARSTSVEKTPTDVQPTNNQEPVLLETSSNVQSGGAPQQDRGAEVEAEKESGAKASRATRKAPASFVVDAPLLEWARLHVPLVDLDAETEKFRDHTFARAISDWPGAWRNWMRRADETAGAAYRSGRSGAPTPRPTETAYQKSTRETIEGLAPGVARRSTFPSAFLDLDAGGADHVAAIAGR